MFSKCSTSAYVISSFPGSVSRGTTRHVSRPTCAVYLFLNTSGVGKVPRGILTSYVYIYYILTPLTCLPSTLCTSCTTPPHEKTLLLELPFTFLHILTVAIWEDASCFWCTCFLSKWRVVKSLVPLGFLLP